MSLAQRYSHLIGRLIRDCGGPDKFAHTYAGLALWLLAGAILRKPMRSVVPLAVVLTLELANEMMDWLTQGLVDWPDASGDLLATMFWPSVLTLVAWRASVRA